MPRFFVSEEAFADGTVTVGGDDAHHISRSLRMAAGEHITVCNGQGREYDCELTQFLPDRVVARVTSEKPSQTEPPYRVTLYQALPKGEKMDSIIQKAVECGVTAIVPFESEHCIARDGDRTEKHTERRARIALEAAKQCGRGIIPEVRKTVSFGQMLKEAAAVSLPLFCYEGEGTDPLPQALRTETVPDEIAIVVGSEGGFSVREAQAARTAGLHLIGLGARILRTETASGFVLSCLSFRYELPESRGTKETAR